MYTNPSKKGGYGVPKTTLSERQGPAGVVGEYSYAADPIDVKLQKQREESEKERKARVTDKPFKPNNPTKKGGFGYSKMNVAQTAQGCVGEYEYIAEGTQPHKPPPSDLTPFKPTSFPKSGYNSTLNKFPEHAADPEAVRIAAAKTAQQKAREACASANAWRPANVPRTYMTRSIIRMNT